MSYIYFIYYKTQKYYNLCINSQAGLVKYMYLHIKINKIRTQLYNFCIHVLNTRGCTKTF